MSETRTASVLDGVFGRSGTLRRPPVSRLPGELTSYLTYHPPRADPAEMPHGDGHHVLVVPALMTPDPFTLPLRNFLDACGFNAHGWGQGVNLGPTERAIEGLKRRLAELSDRAGEKVSVAGISMGGVLARNLAHDCPDRVERLVSIVSPTRFPTASNAEPVVNALRHLYSRAVDSGRYNLPVPMPSLAIYSRDDGIIAWETCTGDEACERVEVRGAHVAICRNPDVQAAVARFLAPVPAPQQDSPA